MTFSRLLRAAAATAAIAALAACDTGTGRTEYAGDGDSGAAAPATVQTVNVPQAPDSTAGISQRSGQRGVAGDTLSSSAKTPPPAHPVRQGNTTP